MRPIALEFQAFKVFPGQHRIDFAALATKGVFLIVGNNGTGKTSIFDAMFWALFGKLPGEGRGDGNARSNHAPPDRPTYVDFEFESRGERYLVRRVEVETDVDKTSLSRLTGVGTEPIATGARNVTKACEDAVGLGWKQFQSVVLLPQGEFAKFLTETETPRRDMLSTLFDAALFKGATKALKSLSAQAQGRAEEITKDIDRIRESCSERLRGQANLREIDSGLTDESDPDQIARAVGDLRKVLKRERSAQAALNKEARRADEEASVALRAAEAWDDLASQRKRKRELGAQKAGIQQARLRRAKSVRARPVVDARVDVEKLQTAWAESKKTAQAARARTEGLRRRHVAKADALRKLRGAGAGESDDLSGQIKALTDLLSARRELGGLQKELDTAQDRSRDLSDAYRRTQAARLAETLSAGSPCPVCGSLEHPRTARSPRGMTPVDDRAVDAARAEEERIRRDLARVAGDAARLQGALGDLGTGTQRELQERKRKLSARLSAARKAEETVGRLERDLEELEEAIEDSTASMNDANDQMRTAAGRLETGRSHLAKQLKESGFASLAAAARALLTPSEEERIAVASGTWDTEMQAVTVRLTTLREMKPAIPRVRPDEARLKAKADAARGAADEALEACKELALVLDEVDASLRNIEDATGRLGDVQTEADLITQVYQVCDGTNGLGMTLENWILTAELDQVIAQANNHLVPLSDGNHTLLRKDVEARPDSLALGVFDASSGDVLDVRELSGGEKFMAALSLALGLADVVSQGATGSGVSFEALFIDEGFDALDSNNLERVADILGRLQSQGRMVAAISHVAGLRETLDLGIEVRKIAGRGASTLEVKV